VTVEQRVLRAITRLNIGGPARQALLLTHALSPEFATTLVAGAPALAEGELEDPRVRPVRAPLVRAPSPPNDARALAQLRRLMTSERPAIVHSHMAKAGALSRIAARTLRDRPKIVHTFHGHVLEGYFGAAVERAFIATERALARTTDLLVAVSTEVRDDLLELGIGRPEQWRVLPLGLDLDAHRRVADRSGVLRSRLGLGDDAVLVGLVGRLVPIKDPATTLEAIARVPDVHLVVAGDGELRDAVAATAGDLGIRDRVHLIGWMADVPALMADLDIVVLSSRNEGTPVALIEAAACARPVVATDVGGVRSVVADGQSGFLVPAGDHQAMATAIARLAADDDLRRVMGLHGRLRSNRWSADRLVADVRSLYRELLAR